MAYVYAVLVDGIIRYIGKGTRQRRHEHLRKVLKIARRQAAGEIVETSRFYALLTAAWLDGSKITTEVLAHGLTAREAYALEAREMRAREDLWNGKLGRKSSAAAQWRVDADWRARHKAAMAIVNADAEFKAKFKKIMKRTMNKEEVKAKTSEASKQLWQQQREKMVTGLHRTYDAWTDEQRQQHAEKIKAGVSEEGIKNRAAKMKAIWKTPEHRAKLAQSVEKRFQARSEGSKSFWASMSPEERAAFSKRRAELSWQARREKTLH